MTDKKLIHNEANWAGAWPIESGLEVSMGILQNTPLVKWMSENASYYMDEEEQVTGEQLIEEYRIDTGADDDDDVTDQDWEDAWSFADMFNAGVLILFCS